LNVLIIYFSQTGNTEKIAERIQNGIIKSDNHCDLEKIKNVKLKSLVDYDLIGIGTPTFYFREPVNIKNFIMNLEKFEDKHCFMFATHGSVIGNTFYYMDEELSLIYIYIASILKAIGHQKRFKILVSLLEGAQSFGYLLKETNLQRTALSNHLTTLVHINLIEKVDFGIYNITEDGLEFMKALDKAYYESPTRKLERFENLQRGKISESFLYRFKSD